VDENMSMMTGPGVLTANGRVLVVEDEFEVGLDI
jgi:hypothetical protein